MCRYFKELLFANDALTIPWIWLAVFRLDVQRIEIGSASGSLQREDCKIAFCCSLKFRAE
jgi:hypothetical protein